MYKQLGPESHSHQLKAISSEIRVGEMVGGQKRVVPKKGGSAIVTPAKGEVFIDSSVWIHSVLLKGRAISSRM